MRRFHRRQWLGSIVFAADGAIGIGSQPLSYILHRAHNMFAQVVIDWRVRKDKVGTRMRVAWGSLGAPTDERQHKRVKPCIKEMQGFIPITEWLATSKRRSVHDAKIYHPSSECANVVETKKREPCAWSITIICAL